MRYDKDKRRRIEKDWIKGKVKMGGYQSVNSSNTNAFPSISHPSIHSFYILKSSQPASPPVAPSNDQARTYPAN